MTKSKPPPHVESISIENFRGFKKEQNIRLAPLTFLVGPNSAGKSSLFDALLLIAQSHFSMSEKMQVPNWVGPLVDLGAFDDCVYRHDTSLSIRIELQLSRHFARSTYPYHGVNVEQPMRVMFELKTTWNDPIGRLSAIAVVDPTSNECLQFRYGKDVIQANVMGNRAKGSSKNFYWGLRKRIQKMVTKRRRLKGKKAAWQRIMRTFPLNNVNSVLESAERVSSGRSAPRRWYSLAEATFDYGTGRSKLFTGVEPLVARRSPYHQWEGFKTYLNSVLGALEIGDQLQDTKLSPYHIALKIRDSVTGVTSNLIDVGFGASQVIPVVWGCLSNATGPLFIEQPEIHLHPRAQGTLADLICQSSQRRQVVVETHSVHMINRARIMIAEGKLDPGHVVVNYVERHRDGSHVHTIPVLPNGDFGREWPDGFFDERYEDTMLLLKLKSQKAR